jgi:hypothetical protein
MAAAMLQQVNLGGDDLPNRAASPFLYANSPILAPASALDPAAAAAVLRDAVGGHQTSGGNVDIEF